MSSAALLRRDPPDPRTLQRCLLLAVLLHVWLVLVFGNATGTAAPGQGVWGSLTVKLSRGGGQAGAPPGEPAPEQRDNGAPGSAPNPRQGGRVRAVEPTTTDTGAAALGRWTPQETPPDPLQPEPAPDIARSPAPNAAAAQALRTLRTGETAEHPITPLQPLRPLASPPLAARAADISTDLPAAVNRLEAPADTRIRPQPTPDLRLPTPAATAIAIATDLPAPVNRLEPVPRDTLPALVRPAELRAPNTAAPVMPPSLDLPGAVRRLESDGPTRAARPDAPLTRPEELRGAASTSATAIPSAADLPATVHRLEAGDSSTAPLPQTTAQRVTPPAPARTATTTVPELSSALPGPVTAPPGTSPGDPAATPSSFTTRSPAGSPDAGSRLGRDLATPPSAAASAPRAPLNLSLPRSGDMTARRSPGLLELVPPPPEQKSKLEKSIEEAAKADCRKAYAGAGLLAVVPLAIDTVRSKGSCKW